MHPVPEPERRLSAITGAVFFCLFSVLGVLVSGFLTIVKFRSAVQCDESFLSACQLGSWFDCNTVLTSPWSTWFQVPISVYATAFYLAGLWLAARLLRSPDEHLPATRPLLLLFGWVGVLVVIPLAWYAAFEIGSFCPFCVLIYLINFALFLAAWLANPRGPIGGLAGLAPTGESRLLPVLMTTVLFFSAALTVQMAIYLRNEVNVEVETQCLAVRGSQAAALLAPLFAEGVRREGAAAPHRRGAHVRGVTARRPRGARAAGRRYRLRPARPGLCRPAAAVGLFVDAACGATGEG